MAQYTRSASKPCPHGSNYSYRCVACIRDEERDALQRIFGSTRCWKCDKPPTAQVDGIPYCSQAHHPDPVKRTEP